MAYLVFMGLLVLSVVYVGIAKKQKKALLVLAVLLGMFVLYVKYTCGPNRADVKIMKPMAEKISEYIEKHGIPKSLKDIPDLPYELVGCERKMEYWKTKIVGAEKVKNLSDATGIIIYENCNFKMNNEKYYINTVSRYEKDSNINEMDIYIGNKQSGTEGLLVFSTNEHKIVSKHFNINFSTGKTSGICNPMRQ